MDPMLNAAKMTPERRADLEKRRAELRAKRESRAALDKCIRCYWWARFGPEAADVRADQILAAVSIIDREMEEV